MKLNFLFLLSTSWIFMAGYCEKGCENHPEDYYEFETPVTLTPTSSTISVGDTLTFFAQFGPEFTERLTGKTYVIDTFPQPTTTKIIGIDEETPDFRAIEDFEILIDSIYDYAYTSSNNVDASALYGSYRKHEGAYELEYRLVATQPGLYLFRHGSDLEYPFDPDFDGRCYNAVTYGVTVMNGGGDNNIELLLESPDEAYNDLLYNQADTKFHPEGYYVFKVE